MTSFEKSTLNWAKTAVLMSTVAALFVCLQWIEMHTGSKDTAAIKVAAQEQAAATDKFANAASGINSGVTDTVAKLSDQVKKMDASRISSERESRAELQATIDNFHNENRAWVGISSAIPIGFNAVSSNSPVSMIVAFTYRNYGHTAAHHVHFFAALESDPTIYSVSCDDVAAKNKAGDILLPSQEQTLNWVMTLTRDQIVDGWKHQNPALGDALSLKVVGCIEYADKAGEAPHRTPFSYLAYSQGSIITPNTTLTGDQLKIAPIGTESNQAR
jgi:hypothetical protein